MARWFHRPRPSYNDGPDHEESRLKGKYRRIALLLALAATASAAAQQPEHTASLQGRVYLGRNAPVIGMTVLVQSEERPTDLYLTSSDENGVFNVDGLPDGLYRVRAVREGLVTRVMEDISVKYPFRAVVELAVKKDDSASSSDALAATAEAQTLVGVTGKVVEHGAGPIGEVRLRFVKEGGGDDPRILRSAADGSFALPAIRAGEWRVEADGVGMLPQRIELALEADVELTVIMVRQPQGYEQSPTELMPPEQPIPPSG